MCEGAAIGKGDKLGEGVGSFGTFEEGRVPDLLRYLWLLNAVRSNRRAEDGHCGVQMVRSVTEW